MTEEMKEKCREEIERGGWHKWGIIEPKVDPLSWDKVLDLMYEDMDGNPCICRAIYERQVANSWFFRAIDGAAKGNRMSGVIAWRESENQERG